MKVDVALKFLKLLFPGFVLLTACSTSTPVVEESQEQSVEAAMGAAVLQQGASGELLAGTCFGCHGPQGRSKAPAIPSLAGLSEKYFIRVMQAYQYGGRYGSVMGRIALGFDSHEITRMANYFSQFEVQSNAQRVSWRQVDKGRRLHQLYCLECHGDPTQAPTGEANLLHGQWMDYLRWTLQDYLIGINQADAEMSQQLSSLVRRHGSAGLEALVNYLGSARQ